MWLGLASERIDKRPWHSLGINCGDRANGKISPVESNRIGARVEFVLGTGVAEHSDAFASKLLFWEQTGNCVCWGDSSASRTTDKPDKKVKESVLLYYACKDQMQKPVICLCKQTTIRAIRAIESSRVELDRTSEMRDALVFRFRSSCIDLDAWLSAINLQCNF